MCAKKEWRVSHVRDLAQCVRVLSKKQTKKLCVEIDFEHKISCVCPNFRKFLLFVLYNCLFLF